MSDLPLRLGEIQVAYMLGYPHVAPFRRAVRRGNVPAPDEYESGKPIWYRSSLERRYGVERFTGESERKIAMEALAKVS